MLTYQECKELRDAGFKQSGPDFGYRTREDGEMIYAYYFDQLFEVRAPTLSSLIAACGEGFYQLEHRGSYWNASSWIDNDENILTVQGSTPDEAVAKLWLALNKK